jgi:hypothetical protein
MGQNGMRYQNKAAVLSFSKPEPLAGRLVSAATRLPARRAGRFAEAGRAW